MDLRASIASADSNFYHLVPDADPDTEYQWENTPYFSATKNLTRSSTLRSRSSARSQLCDDDIFQHVPTNLRATVATTRMTNRARSYGLLCGGGVKEEKTHLQLLGDQLESAWFQALMALLILLNSVVIGLETDFKDLFQWDLVENIFLGLFFLELVLKLVAFGPSTIYSFSHEDWTWNFFDTLIVCAGLFDALVGFLAGTSSGGIATLFRILRLLRILRIFRIVRFLKQLYLLIHGFSAAAKAVGWVTVLMVFLLYVCSIVLVRTVGNSDPENSADHFLREKFVTVGISMFTLFELMASPSVQEYQAQEGLLARHPFFTAFLIIWVIFGSFGMIALLTGVISESMFDKNQVRMEEERLERENQHRFLEDWCKDEFETLETNDSGEAAIEDVAELLLPKVKDMCEFLGADYKSNEVANLHEIMDTDDSGNISCPEFCRAVLAIVEGTRPVSFQEIRHAVSQTTAKIDSNTLILKNVIQLLEDARPTAPRFASRKTANMKRPRSSSPPQSPKTYASEYGTSSTGERPRPPMCYENGTNSTGALSFGASEACVCTSNHEIDNCETTLGPPKEVKEVDRLLMHILERVDRLVDMQLKQTESVDGILKIIHGKAINFAGEGDASQGRTSSRRDTFGTAKFGLADVFPETERTVQSDKEFDFAEMSAKLDNACRKLEQMGIQVQAVSTQSLESRAADAEGEAHIQEQSTSVSNTPSGNGRIDELMTSHAWTEALALMLEERGHMRRFVHQMLTVLDGSRSQVAALFQNAAHSTPDQGDTDCLSGLIVDLEHPPDVPVGLVSSTCDLVHSPDVPLDLISSAQADAPVQLVQLDARLLSSVPHEFSFSDKHPDVPNGAKDLNILRSQSLGLHFDSSAWAAVSPLGSRNVSVEPEDLNQ